MKKIFAKIADVSLRFIVTDISLLIRLLGSFEAALGKHIAEQDKALARIDADISSLTADRAKVASAKRLATGLQAGVSNLRG